ncbi:SbcC/MukB-like Walker B domain-containing protein [Pseudorhodoplanes sp.]|uniref:SbcC/MukB-like Walker B domain-containing protein n=1 Tax=Pseudorhodoplanes sp. TaxID=1934341 RepID=UPI003D12FF18
MMELRHIAMVNWHLFDVEDIEIGGHCGVFGENRSGKSTILDMAQVVLTGGNRNVQRLNAVAGDKGKTRSASKRSVVDYCLGTLGEDVRRREQARTYVALGFADTDGQRPPVTIGMAIEARKSESNETVLGRFVAVGSILTTRDFIEVRKDGRFPAEWDDVRSRIVKTIGEQNFVNHRDKTIDYVREYMRHLVPHASFVGEQNANSLQKAIVNAMTLDHDQTATQFVRGYILEKNNMKVGELRESIQTYRNINETIRKMRDRLDALKALRVILTELQEAYERESREHWISTRSEWLAARAANREFKEKLKSELAQRDAAKFEVDYLDEDIKDIDAEIERLNIAILEHDNKSGRHALRQTWKTAEEAAARVSADFKKRVDALLLLQPLCAMRGFGFDEDILAIETVVRLTRDVRIDRLVDGMSAAEAALLKEGPALLKKVDETRQKLFGDAADLRARRDRIRDRIRQHSLGQAAAHLTDVTRDLCQKLRQNGMAPRVLCDLVEVSNPEWTAAAEGLLGRDREAVFVDRPHVGQATTIFKAGRREFRGASLVSLNKLEAHRTAPQPGTFPSVFRTQDPDAMAFIMRRHASVRLANDLGAFNQPGRAIMKDGLYDDGLVRTHRGVDPSTFKIGKTAQAKALKDMEEQADELDEEAEKIGRAASSVDAAHGALRALCDDSAFTLSALAAAHAKAVKEGDDADERIAALDTSGDGGLRDKRKAQTELKATRASERVMQQGLFNKHEIAAGICAEKLSDGENVPGSLLNMKVAWSIFRANLPLYDRTKGRAAHRGCFGARGHKRDTDRHRAVAAKAAADEASAKNDRIGGERRVREALGTYFDTFGVSSQVGTESEPLREVKPWMDQLIEEIETNELRRYERQARDAADKAATLLRGEFINALMSRINKMERELQSMNRGLHDHPFHSERYSFHHTRVAEFQPILKIIEIGKTSPEALGMIFKGVEVPADFPHKDTIAELEALLEDPEKDFAQFEDYRNFYTFEIHMEDVNSGRTTRWESRRGTGSGAEQQVPIYVAIGASLASVYGSSDRRPGQPAGIALAIFDEAFSKMDGKNQRQMMSFYKKLGLQIVIAAPNEKRVAVLEHIDTVVEVDRIGEGARAAVVHLKERARVELRAMDPDTMSDSDLQPRIAAE